MSTPRPQAKRNKKQTSSLQRAPPAPHYDFTPLLRNHAALRAHAKTSAKTGDLILILNSRDTTYELTRAILKDHFNLAFTIPTAQLVPTVPNRVQYLSWAAALLGPHATGEQRTVVDIGTGPSCIYALLGTRLYPAWKFVATDTDPVAINSARHNVGENDLRNVTVLQTLQKGKLLPADVATANPHLTVCNPPFYAELPDVSALPGSQTQLVTEGGEYAFLARLADESTHNPSVEWFTSLVGRKIDLPRLVSYLRSSRIRAPYVKTVELSQGGRTTRWAVAWSFGQETSQVVLVDDHGSKWRHVLSVRPARRFANQLGADDIAATFSSVLDSLNWDVQEESPINGECGVVFQRAQNSSSTKTALHLHTTQGVASNEFLLHLKVRDRGEMLAREFSELGVTIVRGVSEILNE